ncbi:hypothetical protein PHISP_08692, partial [Aspergillus sp. HF37]
AAHRIWRHRIRFIAAEGAGGAVRADDRRLADLQAAGAGTGRPAVPGGRRDRHQPPFRPLARAQGLCRLWRGHAG